MCLEWPIVQILVEVATREVRLFSIDESKGFDAIVFSVE